MDKIRFGVVGLGHQGGIWKPVWLLSKTAE